jgi:para-aminobenzoate synthetase/4-amino-4-deoxychorismate lyase
MIERAVIRDSVRGCWMQFRNRVDVVETFDAHQVCTALDLVERAVEERGLFAAGFLCYEAASAFDPAMRVRAPSGELPLLSFALFASAEPCATLPVAPCGEHYLDDPGFSLGYEEYALLVAAIREHIARGDSYQVNLTQRLTAAFRGDPRSLFVALHGAQQASCAAYLHLGTLTICSASPELFFALDGHDVTCRPMKGTSPRGLDLESDQEQMEWLRVSEKNRAENLMIVDMVRNDLGRIAEVGTVHVSDLWTVERYPTVLQMTSTVRARTRTSLVEVVQALFPSASITGAPKIRAMELISQLERGPRDVYTGAIGFVAPGRRAHFNVAIRTAVVDPASERLVFGVGGGIVWDSDPDDEYRECVVKARVLVEPPPRFELLETLLWDPHGGYFLLDRHLRRLADAAAYFVRPFSDDHTRATLKTRAEKYTPEPHRVRLLVAPDGAVSIEADPVKSDTGRRPVRLGLAEEPIDSRDPLLRFKTTQRATYTRALATRPDCHDVLLWNERGEVTESTMANVVLRIDGVLVTPAVSSGLLAGTFRGHLLEQGEIEERVISVDEIAHATGISLINSVRRWIEVAWLDHTLPPHTTRFPH